MSSAVNEFFSLLNYAFPFLKQQQSQYRKKLFEASHCLRSMMFGQDRYRRRYWILPQCGGIFVEGMESGEGKKRKGIMSHRGRLCRDILPISVGHAFAQPGL